MKSFFLVFFSVSLHAISYNRLGDIHFYEIFEKYYPQWFDRAFTTKHREFWMYNKEDTIREFADFLDALFAKHYNSQEPTAEEAYRIPPLIHQIWLGDPLPDECQVLQQTWLQQLPEGWTYKLWTEKEIDEFHLYNKELYDAAINYAQKSDIARYEILLREGGLYIDFDCENIRFDDIIRYHKQYDFYAAVEPAFYNFMIGNAVIACISYHPVMRNMVYSFQRWIEMALPLATRKDMPAWFFTALTTGPGFLSAAIWNHCDKEGNKDIIFPPVFFYPFVTRIKHEPVNETCIIHHFHNSWFVNDL